MNHYFASLDVFEHPEHGRCLITDGAFIRNGRVSNHYTFRQIGEDGYVRAVHFGDYSNSSWKFIGRLTDFKLKVEEWR